MDKIGKIAAFISNLYFLVTSYIEPEQYVLLKRKDVIFMNEDAVKNHNKKTITDYVYRLCMKRFNKINNYP